MTKLKYVGLKEGGERAFQEETGIEWLPGSEHDVTPAQAAKMLKHPDVFALADGSETADTASLAEAKKPAERNPGIPAWAKAGIDAGLSDEQLESLAQVGGPDTEAGAKLWLELTGKAFATEPPPPAFVMRMADGMPRILDGMTREALFDLAAELRVKVHPMTGAPKIMAALVAAYPLKK